MKSQLLCLLFVAFVVTCFGMVFDCVNSNNCDKCPPLPENCQNTTKCGCCDICKDTLKQGESCVMTIVMTTLSQKQCGPDLMCDQDTMKCEPKSIVMSKLFPEDGNKLISQHHDIPDSVRCNGSVCFCAYEGEQLHRYELLKQEHIGPYSCKCAIAKETYQRTKLVGQLFVCDEQGSYKKMQCTGSECYCVNEAGEKLHTGSFHVSESENYNC